MEYFKVTNWDEYQHYKDRNPPWIKLHFSLLSSPDWVMLSDRSRVLAIACMLLASRNRGLVPNDPKYLRRVAYLNSDADFTQLLETGFLSMLADASTCKQTQAKDTQEERREETETEESRDSSEPLPRSDQAPAVVMSFPCVGEPDRYDLTKPKLAEYVALYGSVIDVEFEARKARQWIIDNQGRRKTAKGMARFLGSWFERAVNSKPANGKPDNPKPQSLAERIRRYNTEHPGNSKLHVIRAVGTPQEIADYEQRLREYKAARREPSEVTHIGDVEVKS